MKHLSWIALCLATLICLTACGKVVVESPAPSPNEVVASPAPESNIPDASTQQAPTAEGESYEAVGMYIGMADNNLLVMIEANPEDGKPEKSYQISPEIDLDAMGITDGDTIQITYTVDENGIKRIKTIAKSL